MSDNGSEQKKYQYMVTMRWYVETDEELVAGAADTDEKLLEIVRHRKDGSKSCSTCPTRNNSCTLSTSNIFSNSFFDGAHIGAFLPITIQN